MQVVHGGRASLDIVRPPDFRRFGKPCAQCPAGSAGSNSKRTALAQGPAYRCQALPSSWGGPCAGRYRHACRRWRSAPRVPASVDATSDVQSGRWRPPACSDGPFGRIDRFTGPARDILTAGDGRQYNQVRQRRESGFRGSAAAACSVLAPSVPAAPFQRMREAQAPSGRGPTGKRALNWATSLAMFRRKAGHRDR